MAARDVALDHHRDRAALAAAAEEYAAELWSRVDQADIVASWAAQLPELTAVTTAAQQQAAATADAYLTVVLDEQGLGTATDVRPNPRSLAGIASDGRPLVSLLTRPAFTTMSALTVSAPLDVALAAGLASVRMIVATQVADAGRVADGVALTGRPTVPGYVRMVVGRTCSRCIVLAGRRYRWNHGFDRHPKCDCVHIPSAEAAPDVRTDPKRLFAAMSPAEQDRAFGRTGAEAIREGADIGQVVNARRGMYTAGGQDLTRESASRRPRLMPEQIYREAAGDRAEAIRLLRLHGYLI